MNISFRILVIKMSDGNWLPSLLSSPECPTPSYVVIHGTPCNLSEEEWIEKYKVLNGADSVEFKFVDIGTVEF